MAVEPARAHSKMVNDAPHFIRLGFLTKYTQELCPSVKHVCVVGLGFLPYNSSFAENITVFTDSNKICEAMERGNFGRSSGVRYPHT
jgi:hypothetical protein